MLFRLVIRRRHGSGKLRSLGITEMLWVRMCPLSRRRRNVDMTVAKEGLVDWSVWMDNELLLESLLLGGGPGAMASAQSVMELFCSRFR
jgi:hypothetical protein